jgi:Bacterial RNA polymerase, alpha chain C terminal domain
LRPIAIRPWGEAAGRALAWATSAHKIFASGVNSPLSPSYKPKAQMPETPDSTPIEDLDISIRLRNACLNANILTVGDMRRVTDGEMLRRPNFGRVSLAEMRKFAPYTGPFDAEQELCRALRQLRGATGSLLSAIERLEDIRAQIVRGSP